MKTVVQVIVFSQNYSKACRRATCKYWNNFILAEMKIGLSMINGAKRITIKKLKLKSILIFLCGTKAIYFLIGT